MFNPDGSGFGGNSGSAAADPAPALKAEAPPTNWAPYVPKPPRVSVIVTHFNYSHMVEDALRSALAQDYPDFEIIVVDDASDAAHRDALREIVARLAAPRIRLVELDENVGQIMAFYAGFDVSSGDFVCLLDPDDRYTQPFLNTMIQLHLNQFRIVPMICADQIYLQDGREITGCYAWQKACVVDSGEIGANHHYENKIKYYSHSSHNWPWTSTSAMMFRRTLISICRPYKTLAYRGSADSYLGNGARFLGGTFVYERPLVYRSVHETNVYLSQNVICTGQQKAHLNGEERNRECRVDVLVSIIKNGGAQLFSERYFSELLQSVFDKSSRKLIQESCPGLIGSEIIKRRKRPGSLKRLRRISKRILTWRM